MQNNKDDVVFYISLIEKGFNFVDHISELTYHQRIFLSKGYDIYNKAMDDASNGKSKGSTKKIQNSSRGSQMLRE